MHERVSLWLTCLGVWLDGKDLQQGGSWWDKWHHALPDKDYLDEYELDGVINEH